MRSASISASAPDERGMATACSRNRFRYLRRVADLEARNQTRCGVR